MTHTYAAMEVTAATFEEVELKLQEAGYVAHAIEHKTLDMHGVALEKEEADVRDGTYSGPKHGWTCFHCGRTFIDEKLARIHFGERPTAVTKCSAMQEACEAALVYDDAIRKCAGDPDRMASFCTAEGDDLDSLYADWMVKARDAVRSD